MLCLPDVMKMETYNAWLEMLSFTFTRAIGGRMHHDGDPRYNHVILHVVLIYNDNRPTRRQDGVSIPVCSLNDLASLQPGPIM